jgi:Uma2 family endonuclease
MEHLTIEELRPRRFRVEDYYRMAEVGLIGPEDRVELLEGLILEKTPQKRPHARLTSALTGRLTKVLPRGEYSVRIQLPLSVSDESEPEPDVAVVRAEDELTSPREHPISAPLIIEVADSSLGKDRLIKVPLYARAGVSEYVIADLTAQRLEVYTKPVPTEGRFEQVRLVERGATWECSTLPAVRIPVSELFD